MKNLNYAIIGSGICAFIASLKIRNSTILTKLKYNASDVTKILNFYEYNNPGGNSNIWGAYINLHRFRAYLAKNKKFKNFYLRNKFFSVAKLSNNSSFKKVGYLKNKVSKKIFRLDKNFFINPLDFELLKIRIKKKHVELISNNKRFNVKKLNLCIGNISLIRILKNSDLIHDTDIISYEDSAIKYGLNLKLNHKKYYYIPMSIKQIIEKVLYRSLYYNDNDNNRNLFIQAVSNKKKIFRFSVEQLLSSKKSFYRGLTTNHIANLRINNISIENYLLKKSKRIIVNCTGTIPYYVPGSISQELIYNTFIKS